jgi:hypothetical protein
MERKNTGPPKKVTNKYPSKLAAWILERLVDPINSLRYE